MKWYVVGSFQMYPVEKPKYSWLDKNIVNTLQRKVETPPSLLEWSQLTVMHVTQLVRRQLILGCYSVCLDAARHFHWKSDSGIYLKFVITMTTQLILGGNESFLEEETFKFLHREYQERTSIFLSSPSKCHLGEILDYIYALTSHSCEGGVQLLTESCHKHWNKELLIWKP